MQAQTAMVARAVASGLLGPEGVGYFICIDAVRERMRALSDAFRGFYTIGVY